MIDTNWTKLQEKEVEEDVENVEGGVSEEVDAFAPSIKELDAKKSIKNVSEATDKAKFAEIWIRGIIFIKHGAKGKPRRRRIQLDCQTGVLTWGKVERKKRYMNLFDAQILAGKQTDVFNRVKDISEDVCFSLNAGSDSCLNLECINKQMRDEIIFGLEFLQKYYWDLFMKQTGRDWRDRTVSTLYRQKKRDSEKAKVVSKGGVQPGKSTEFDTRESINTITKSKST